MHNARRGISVRLMSERGLLADHVLYLGNAALLGVTYQHDKTPHTPYAVYKRNREEDCFEKLVEVASEEDAWKTARALVPACLMEDLIQFHHSNISFRVNAQALDLSTIDAVLRRAVALINKHMRQKGFDSAGEETNYDIVISPRVMGDHS